MIVRNEAHVVEELLNSVAPHISSWVIVDTGSDDGTQEVIRNHMGRLGISGELHERPWRDFGHNRTEALTLAQGHGDYIWIMDADDTIVGTPDFTNLSADIYSLRFSATNEVGSPIVIWRPLLVRDGLRVRYEGVVHENLVCDDPHVVARIEGDYHVNYRNLGARSRDPLVFARDRDLLLAEIERNPNDERAVIHLAQTYASLGDFVNARKWFARRVEMGGPPEFLFYAMYQVAESMTKTGASWPDVQDALLRAWEFRPSRAEPLYAIAMRYRAEQRFQLGYQFAKLAAEIPFPEDETLFVNPEIYAWRATEEQAICAGFIGKHAEAFTLFRQLLARPGVSDDARQRISANRDVCAPVMLDLASSYPDAAVQQSLGADPGAAGEVVVSLIAGPDRAGTEATLNSFLRCCTDLSRVGRILLIDVGLSSRDREMLCERYGFIEFSHAGPVDRHGADLANVRAQVDTRFWLHLGQGWRFFAPENFITRLTAVLAAEAQVFQVGINFADAVELTGDCAPEQAVRRSPDAGRYVLSDEMARGPAMFDTARLDQAGGVQVTDSDPIAELGRRAQAAGLRTASLDEILCIASVN
ncbi:MAG: glycosyltransferase [Mycobacteriaceae bacterium]|nr:glycosyltransferase [Mycobacteriaceae bacterium]